MLQRDGERKLSERRRNLRLWKKEVEEIKVKLEEQTNCVTLAERERGNWNVQGLAVNMHMLFDLESKKCRKLHLCNHSLLQTRKVYPLESNDSNKGHWRGL